jgi:hypothetical protein
MMVRFMRDCDNCGAKFRPTGKHTELCDDCWKKKRCARGIRSEKKLHKVWVERHAARKKGVKIRRLVGKWQYIYTSTKGTVSLIQTIPPGLDFKGKMIWELGVAPKTKDGEWLIERYPTKTKAYERVRELLL